MLVACLINSVDEAFVTSRHEMERRTSSKIFNPFFRPRPGRENNNNEMSGHKKETLYCNEENFGESGFENKLQIAQSSTLCNWNALQ